MMKFLADVINALQLQTYGPYVVIIFIGIILLQNLKKNLEHFQKTFVTQFAQLLDKQAQAIIGGLNKPLEKLGDKLDKMVETLIEIRTRAEILNLNRKD